MSPERSEPETVPAYRSAITDALGRPIPYQGPISVWLDDDLVDRAAPEGWIHVITAREACLLLKTGRVEQLSLDHDLGDDPRFGTGHQVIDYLDEMSGILGRALWPSDVLQLHTANVTQRDAMARGVLTSARRHRLTVQELAPAGTKRRFAFSDIGLIENEDWEERIFVLDLGEGRDPLCFFNDDGALARSPYNPAHRWGSGPYDVLTRWGWRRRSAGGLMLERVYVREAIKACAAEGVAIDAPLSKEGGPDAG